MRNSLVWGTTPHPTYWPGSTGKERRGLPDVSPVSAGVVGEGAVCYRKPVHSLLPCNKPDKPGRVCRLQFEEVTEKHWSDLDLALASRPEEAGPVHVRRYGAKKASHFKICLTISCGVCWNRRTHLLRLVRIRTRRLHSWTGMLSNHELGN